MALLVVACSSSSVTTGPSVSSTTDSSASVPTIPTTRAKHLSDFPIARVEVAGDTWRVAVADTPERRERGLMGVESLGDLDGMLFSFPSEVTARFWMKDTLIPLDIAFFDGAGVVVAVLQMEPCTEDPCPTYGPDRPFRYALEAPRGGLIDLEVGARLVVD